MALLKYVRYINKHKKTEKENEFELPTKVSVFSHEELKEVNNGVSKVMQSKSSQAQGHVNYNKYTPDQRAMIGRYAAENGPTRAANHFTKILKMKIPKPTVRRLKKEYLVRLNEVYTEQKQRRPITQKVVRKLRSCLLRPKVGLYFLVKSWTRLGKSILRI